MEAQSSPPSISSAASSVNSSTPSTPSTTSSFDFSDHVTEQTDRRYILVTGGLGFIGSHTSLELLKAGYDVIIVDDLSNSYRSVLNSIIQLADIYYAGREHEQPKVHHHQVNYRDMEAMDSLLREYSIGGQFGRPARSKIMGVIHFAAFKAVAESISRPLDYYRNNINGLVDFLYLLDDHKIKNFVFSSSATVYGTIADLGVPVREEDCVHEPEHYLDDNQRGTLVSQGCTGLTNPYGRTKFFGEAILSDLAKSDPLWSIAALRYFNPVGCDASGLLGEEPKGVPSNLLPAVTKVLIGDSPSLSVFGDDWPTPDGTAMRDFIHVTDLAQAHIRALDVVSKQAMVKNFRTFNIGTGHGYSVQEVINTMEQVSQRSIPHHFMGRRAGDVGTCVARADRSNAELGWRTKLTLRDACVDICRFLRARNYY